MFFLAIWHGLHSGYLVCFQMELLIVIVEKQVSSVWCIRRGEPTIAKFLWALVTPKSAAACRNCHRGGFTRINCKTDLSYELLAYRLVHVST